MVNLEEVMRDQYKYEIRCSRCGGWFWSIIDILDIIPVICGNCNIGMPVRFIGKDEIVTDNNVC